MKKITDVLAICDMCVDLIFSGSDVVPEFGQKEKLVEDYLMELGGSNCIFASQAAKLGLNVMVVGKVGKDISGEFILNKLKDSHVNIEHAVIDPLVKTGAGVSLCVENDRAILTYPGSIDALTIDEIPFDLFSRCRHFHIGSYYLLKNMRPHLSLLAQMVRKSGGTVSLDTNWDPDEDWVGVYELLPYVDLFLPNEKELLAIAGEKDLPAALKK